MWPPPVATWAVYVASKSYFSRERCEGFFCRNLLHNAFASIFFLYLSGLFIVALVIIGMYAISKCAISYICSLHVVFYHNSNGMHARSTSAACARGLLDLLLGRW